KPAEWAKLPVGNAESVKCQMTSCARRLVGMFGMAEGLRHDVFTARIRSTGMLQVVLDGVVIAHDHDLGAELRVSIEDLGLQVTIAQRMCHDQGVLDAARGDD